MSGSKPRITEPTAAPDVYADGFTCGSLTGGVVKMPFFSVTNTSADGDEEQRIVMRLVMSLPALVGVHRALGELIAGLEAQGLIQRAPEPEKPN